MKLPKLPSLDLEKLASMKNPLKAAADWAERMAGEAAAPIGTPRVRKPASPADKLSGMADGGADPMTDAPAAPEAAEPVFSTFTAEEAEAADSGEAAAAEPFPREAPPKPKAPARPETDFRDVLYTLWSAAIVIGVLGTVVAFVIGAVR